MIKQLNWLSIAAIAAMLMLSACQSSKVGSIQRRDSRGVKAYIADQRIGFSKSFKSRFYVDSLNEAPGDDGILKVQARIRNLTEENQIIEYRFDWSDMNGILVKTPTSRWMIKHVKPGDSVHLLGVAPKPEAKDFYLKLQHKKQ